MLTGLWKWLACGSLCVLAPLAGGCTVDSGASGFLKHVAIEDADNWKSLDACYIVTEFQATDTYFDDMFSGSHTVSPEDYHTTDVTIRRASSGQVICQSALLKPMIPVLTPAPSWWTRSRRYHHHLFRQGYSGVYSWSADIVRLVAIDPGNPESVKAVARDARYWQDVIAPHVDVANPVREELRLVCERNLQRVIREEPKNIRYKVLLDELQSQAP